MKPFKPRYLAVLVFALILAIAAVVDVFARQAHLSEHQSEVAMQADALARDISDVIARETAGVNTLAAFVEITRGSQGDMNELFPVFARSLMESGETIRSVQLAPGAVIRFVYPLAGNEAALGLDLMADPDRRALLEPAIETGSTVVQGPVELVQGGIGILVRRPVYDNDGDFWGFTAILLDWPAVAANTELDEMSGDLIAGARLPEMGDVVGG